MNSSEIISNRTVNKRTEKSISGVNGFFRNILFGKLKNITSGQLTVSDREGKYTFGDPESAGIKAGIRIINPDAYALISLGGGIGAAEAYFNGYWKSGDLVPVIQLFVQNRHLLEKMDGGTALIKKPAALLYHAFRRNTRSGSKKNIEAHYDLSNEFYSLFLDETMNYSSGIFPDEDSSMRDASIEKMDRICRKLDLKPGDHLLEIGTGWGGLAVHAARNYGCRVTTTTISREQYSYALKRIFDENLMDRITIEYKDYRDLEGRYDKLVSVEMIEAVGYNYIKEFFAVCDRLLKKDGIMVLQGITMNDQQFDRYRKSVDFIQRYIFPGSSLISASHILNSIKEKTEMNIFHIEDITPHYARTLKEWRLSFLRNIDRIRKLGFSEQFLKMWEYYFSYCEGGFRERSIGNLQMTFIKPGNRREPILGNI